MSAESASERNFVGRLLLISNRLPITVKQIEDGNYDISEASGVLASCISGLSPSISVEWYGWPGIEVPEDRDQLLHQLREEYNAIPIFLEDELADTYFNGFSSKLRIKNTMSLLS